MQKKTRLYNKRISRKDAQQSEKQLQSTPLQMQPAANYDPVVDICFIKVRVPRKALQLELAPRQETDTSERSRVSIR